MNSLLAETWNEPFFIKFFFISTRTSPNGLRLPLFYVLHQTAQFEHGAKPGFYAAKVLPGQTLQSVIDREMVGLFKDFSYEFIPHFERIDSAPTRTGERLPRYSVCLYPTASLELNQGLHGSWISFLTSRLEPGEANVFLEFFSSLLREGEQAITGQTRLDETEPSVDVLEQFFSQLPDPAANRDALVPMFGSYLGMLMVRHLGARWIQDAPNDSWQLALTGHNGAELRTSPFTKVEKRIENGPEDSLAFYYQTTKQLVTQGLPGRAANNPLEAADPAE